MGKNVRFSRHAIQRKLEREISDEEIAETLAAPDYTLTTEEGQKIAVKTLAGRTFRVVFVEEETHIRIVTVY